MGYGGPVGLDVVGAVSFDKDAIYIDIGRANYTKKNDIQGNKDGDDEEMLRSSPQ